MFMSVTLRTKQFPMKTRPCKKGTKEQLSGFDLKSIEFGWGWKKEKGGREEEEGGQDKSEEGRKKKKRGKESTWGGRENGGGGNSLSWWVKQSQAKQS